MELIRHNNMKTMRRKSQKLWSKDIEPKDKAKGSTKGGGKKASQVPTFDTSISHEDLIISNGHHFREPLDEVKWRQLQI